MKPQHTPTPWFYDAGNFAHNGTVNQGADKRVGSYIRAKRESGVHPAICKMLKIHGYEQNDANAAFIVRAVNCHEELLKACKYLLLCHKNDRTLKHPNNPDAILLGEKVIAKAEEALT